MKKRPPTLVALLSALVGVLLACAVVMAACAITPTREQTEFVETEDCDVEDWRNYDPECGRVSPRPTASKTSTKAPAPARTPAARRSR